MNFPLDELPPGYQAVREFNLRENPRAMIILNVVGFLLFIAAMVLLRVYIQTVRPQDAVLSLSFSGLAQLGLFIGLLIGDVILLVILHEGVHGACFWLITRKRPVFSIGPGYASAAAPDSYIPKKPYLVVALSPLIVLTLVGMLLIPFVASGWVFFVGLFVVMNIFGAVGDLWVAGSLLFRSEPLLVRDFGDRVLVFQAE